MNDLLNAILVWAIVLAPIHIRRESLRNWIIYLSLVVAFVCYVQISNRRPTVEETLQKLEQMVQEKQVKQAHEAGIDVEEWRQRAYLQMQPLLCNPTGAQSIGAGRI
jgi:hypothetical protein